MIRQAHITLEPRPRGFHLVTDEVVSQLPGLGGVEAGLLHVFIQHTSASLTINENADADVPGRLGKLLCSGNFARGLPLPPTLVRGQTTCRPT